MYGINLEKQGDSTGRLAEAGVSVEAAETSRSTDAGRVPGAGHSGAGNWTRRMRRNAHESMPVPRLRRMCCRGASRLAAWPMRRDAAHEGDGVGSQR